MPAPRKFDDKAVKKIRELRSQDPKKYTHNALAERFGVGAGAISRIVRNMSYHDPEYVPQHDGV